AALVYGSAFACATDAAAAVALRAVPIHGRCSKRTSHRGRVNSARARRNGALRQPRPGSLARKAEPLHDSRSHHRLRRIGAGGYTAAAGYALPAADVGKEAF